MSQTVSYPIRLVDSSGNALVGLVVSIYPHGAAQIPANVLQTGTTDATGTISPLPSLTSDAVYDFATNSPQLPDGSFYAADPTEVAVVAGPAGETGSSGSNGTNGGQGVQGVPGHGSTTTTAAITQPAVGGSFTVPALDGTAFPNLAYLLVSDGTNVVAGHVTSGGGTTALVCTATSVTGAGPIAAGAVVTFTGQTGATGPEGPSGGPVGPEGPAGTNGHGATTTTAAVVIPALNGTMSVPLVDAYAFPVLSYAVFTDGTNVVMGQVDTSLGETVSIQVLYSNNYGATLATGAVASFSGVPVPGPEGEPGPAGTPGYGATTTTAAVAMPSVGNGATFPVLSTLAFPIGTLVFLSDGTTSFYGHVSALSSGSSTITVVNDETKTGSPGEELASGAVVTFSGGPGVPGPMGHGATTTTATFVAPAVSASASFPVLDAVAFPQYSYLLVTDGTTAFIAQVTSDNTTTETLTATALQYVAGASGATVAEGAIVTFAGLRGTAGAAGTNGTNGHGTTTTTAAVAAPAVGATVSVPVVDPTAFPRYSTLLVTDGTTAMAGSVSAVSGDNLSVVVSSYPAGAAGATIASGATVTFGGGGSSGGGSSLTPYDSVVLAQSPAHYWPLSDASGSSSAADSVGSMPLTFNGTPTFGFPPLARDGETSAYCDDSNYFIIPGAALNATSDYTATLLFMPGETSNNDNILGLGNGGDNSYLQTLNGYYRLIVNGGGSNLISSVAAGRAVHLAMKQASGSGTSLYLNGMLVAQVNAAEAQAVTQGLLGALVCRVAKLAYWDSAIPLSEILAQVAAAGL